MRVDIFFLVFALTFKFQFVNTRFCYTQYKKRVLKMFIFGCFRIKISVQVQNLVLSMCYLYKMEESGGLIIF